MENLLNIEDDPNYYFQPEKVNNRILYKYVSIENAWRILRDKTIKFTNPKDFNDPFDCYEGLVNWRYAQWEREKVVKNEITPQLKEQLQPFSRIQRRKHLRHLITDKDKLASYQKEALLDIKNKIGVFCLSEVKDNILMWSHYAQNHTGVCIGITLPTIPSAEYLMLPVVYRETLTPLPRNTKILPAIKYWVQTKAADWSYEREIRAISLEFNGILNIDPSFIREVYFGCNIDLELKQELRTYLKKQMKHVRIYQMKINEKTLGLWVK